MAVVSLTAPYRAWARSTIAVEWTGPGAEFDYVTLLDAAVERVAEASLDSESPVALSLPFRTGESTLT